MLKSNSNKGKKKNKMQVTDQVQAVWRCQQCAGQQRNGHLCRDDKYLI